MDVKMPKDFQNSLKKLVKNFANIDNVKINAIFTF